MIAAARGAIAWVTAIVVLGSVTAVAAAEAQSTDRPLRVPFPAADGTLTPATFQNGYALMTLVYDTLMWRDERAVARPWLAHSVRVADRGRSVVVRLRMGARWHDGRPLTAADVAFTFGFFAQRRHPRFTPQLEAIERVRVIDRHTVRFELAHRSPGFSDQPLADVPILPAHLWRDLPRERLAPAGLPVGSGPYRLVARRRDGGYRFVASASYFRGRPAPRRIDVPIIPDAGRMLRALGSRAVDMVPVSLSADQRAQVQGLGVRFVDGPSYNGVMLLLNTRRAPFRRRAAREAVAGAIDVERIVRATGDAVPATRGFAHPASAWAPRQPVHRFTAPPAPVAPRGPTISVLVANNDPLRLEVGRQVVLALIRAGMRARLVERSRAELGRAVGEDGARPDFQAAIWSIPPLVSHDPDFLRALFGRPGRAAPLNHSGYASAAFARLAARTASAPDRLARRTAVEAEQHLLAHDVPAVPLLFSDGSFALRSAAHDGWLFVEGSGVVDKRSFLPAGPARAEPATLLSPDDDAGNSLGTIALVLFVVALALGGIGLLRARR